MKGIFEDLAERASVAKEAGTELLSSMVERVTHICGGETGFASVVWAHWKSANVGTHRPQSGNRETMQIACQQEGGLPTGQGAKGGGLTSVTCSDGDQLIAALRRVVRVRRPSAAAPCPSAGRAGATADLLCRGQF